jgi:hypothetical protein
VNLENAGSVIFAYGSQGRLTILAKGYITISNRHTIFNSFLYLLEIDHAKFSLQKSHFL